ncbi:metal-dependent transcriptional regulator [Pseudonocardia lacus]|uniref:metal-dependent transcriptional regulator n=1 Tax=Pseudonocardia lacus TaxID=2835865 RepID=UPI001BDC40AE|nr:metal-dependent transcriptional regulator [Pseudonocardia lacus]
MTAHDPLHRPRSGGFLDATQMYLREIYELEEESGLAPRQSALTRRLGLSRSSVSQHLARMAQDGLVSTTPRGHVRLTPAGRAAATVVVRKHRLAERLLVDVVGLEWELAHREASRWQYVLGDRVERKLLGLLADPRISPFGDPVPGLDELDPALGAPGPGGPVVEAPFARLEDVARGGGGRVVVCRLFTRLQDDPRQLVRLRGAGVVPGGAVEVAALAADEHEVRTTSAAGVLALDAGAARSILVVRVPPGVPSGDPAGARTARPEARSPTPPCDIP